MEINQITLSSGQTVDYWTVNGIVADDKHSSSTRLHSSGGGGYVGPHGGHVAAPQIHSRTTTRQSVWITDKNQKDHELSLTNVSIPLRVGQRVTARFVRPPGADGGRLETFTNHSSDLFYTWTDQFEPPLNLMASDRGSLMNTLLVVAGAIGCWFAYGRLSGSASGNSVLLWIGILALAGLAVFAGALGRFARRSKLRSFLRAEYVAAVHGLT